MSIFERKTERSFESAVQLGRDAKSILDYEAYYLAVEEVEIDLLERMKLGVSVAEREAASAELRALDRVLTALRRIQSEGEYAEEVLKARNEE